MGRRLEGAALEAAIAGLEGWAHEDDALVRELTFESFAAAFAFLVRVAFLAERSDHHPEIHNVYRSVRLRLQTHDAGGVVTDRDVAFAAEIDGIAG